MPRNRDNTPAEATEAEATETEATETEATETEENSLVVVTRPPVVLRDVPAPVVAALIRAADAVGDGDFVSTGESFPSEVKSRTKQDGTTEEYDDGREQASRRASALVRAMDSRSDGEYRSRTWQNDNGTWTFGIRPKSS